MRLFHRYGGDLALVLGAPWKRGQRCIQIASGAGCDRLRDRTADLVIMHFNAEGDDFKFEPLFDDEVVLIAPRNHALGKSTTADA